MSDFEPVSFEILPILPEEEEQQARALPALVFLSASTENWSEMTTPFGVTLDLPPDFTPFSQDDLSQMLWTTDDCSMFLVTRHEGGGNVTTMIGFEREPTDYEYEGHFRTELAGRIAAISLSRFRHEAQQYYCASLDAGISAGLGLGVAILTSGAEQRELLFNALSTIRVEPSSERASGV
jgi:hypothetical protein